MFLISVLNIVVDFSKYFLDLRKIWPLGLKLPSHLVIFLHDEVLYNLFRLIIHFGLVITTYFCSWAFVIRELFEV